MDQLTLDKVSNDRENNLDFIRFMAATLVIYSHAFPLGAGIGSGDNAKDIVQYITNGSWYSGELAVATFFVISGFLITQSFERSKKLTDFLKARFLRIFPALAVVLMLSTFLLGPIFTKLPLKDYFTHHQTYDYLKSILLFPLNWNLPGVFEDNIYKNSVNGSLWTIPFEVLCYLIVAILGVLGILKYKKLVLLVFLLTLYYHIFGENIALGKTHLFGLEIKKIVELFSYFAAGMIFYVYRQNVPLNKYLAMLSISILALSFQFGGAAEFYIIFGSYLIFYFAYCKKMNFSKFSKYGDFSYGLYIYAFPVQQAVTHVYGGKMSAGVNFVISFVITLALSVLSWHFVEKKALKYKKFSFINSEFRQKSSSLNSTLRRNYLGAIDKVVKVNWITFFIIFVIIFAALKLYNEKPSAITFPFAKNNNIFHGDWLPQSQMENYRWFSKSAAVTLEKKNQSSNNYLIEGFIPETFVEVNKLQVFINDIKVNEMDIKPGNPIQVNGTFNTPGKKVNIKLELNDSHKPKPSEPDQRLLGALISKIEIK